MANELRVYQNFLGGRLTYALPASATVISDGVSNSTTTITSASASFTQADVGATITGTDLPAAVYIASVTNGTTAILSAAATGSGSARTWTINRHLTIHSAAFAAMSTIGTSQHMMASLDEDGLAGEPEVIMVTRHDTSATWCQITRAQESSTARAHVAGTDWVHGPLATDMTRGNVFSYHKRTTGDITVSSSSWSDVGTVPDLSVDAVAGDVLEAGFNFTGNNTGGYSIFFDVATIVSASPVNYLSGCTGAAGDEGFAAALPDGGGGGYARQDVNGQTLYTVVSGDLASGVVTVRPRYRMTPAASLAAIRANANQPFVYWVKNLGPAR